MKFSVITSTYNQLEQLIICFKALERQTYRDFEWIVADDGSSDGTIGWVHELTVDNSKVRYVTQPDEGYRLVEILNKAAKLATGDYLVWIMGDSYPSDDFLERLAKFAEPEKLITGARMNVDEDQHILSEDWRLSRIFYDPDVQDEVPLLMRTPWQLMTLNSMCMPRRAYNRMGGIHEGYKGYGMMDWDMAAWAHFHGMKLSIVTNAIIYHRAHPEKTDTPENLALFDERLKGYQAIEDSENARVLAKMEKITSQRSAYAKKKAIEEKVRQIAINTRAMEREDQEETG